MTKKDYHLYGTKILNLKTQEIGLLICTWKNKFTDAEIDFATCVDRQGKRYNIELDSIRGFEDDFYKTNSWAYGETCELVSGMKWNEMKVKNRRTRETLEIEYSVFRKKFAKDIQVAFDSFRKTELNKPFYNYKDDNSMEFNFYFQLKWNFNHFGNSAWYIEKM